MGFTVARTAGSQRSSRSPATVIFDGSTRVPSDTEDCSSVNASTASAFVANPDRITCLRFPPGGATSTTNV